VRNNFTDLKELLVVILYPDSSLSGLPMPIWQIWADSIVRLFGRVTSLPSVLTGSIAALSFAHVIIYRRKWQVLMGLWFLGGIFFVSFYKGALFDHYLYFLLPFPFFLFGGILAQFGKKTHRNLLYGVIVIISLFHIRSTDIGRNGYGDVRRTHATTREIVRQAGSKRFAFGLISSRSYSDLHYRYYFLLQKAVPEYVTERSFEILFLVCETEICPEPQDITGNRKVTMICYDFYCSGDYPSLDVTQWEFVRFADVRGAKIYTYLRTDKENSVTR
jgi:hypothetical protein